MLIIHQPPFPFPFTCELQKDTSQDPSLRTVPDRVSEGDWAAPPHLYSPNPGRRLPPRASPRPPPDPSGADKPPDGQTLLISLLF